MKSVHRYIDMHVRKIFIQNILLNAKFRFFLKLRKLGDSYKSSQDNSYYQQWYFLPA